MWLDYQQRRLVHRSSVPGSSYCWSVPLRDAAAVKKMAINAFEGRPWSILRVETVHSTYPLPELEVHSFGRGRHVLFTDPMDIPLPA